jgi:hypothetical protein
VLWFRIEVCMQGWLRSWSLMLLGLALLAFGCKTTAEAPTGLGYSANPAVYTVGVAILANTPTHGGGGIDAYAVSPALPSGLSLDAKSGVISGTPTVAAAVATYTVTGSNSAGSTSVGLNLTVNALSLVITTQPVNQSINVGQTATFSVVAAGTGTLSYQWSKGGLPIPSATQASYTTPIAALADTGNTYSVQVSDAFSNSVTSTTATLTVLSAGGPGTFLATAVDMSIARASHTATLLPSGQVLLVGGSNGGFLGTAEVYDPATDTFTPTTGSLATAREFHTATLLQNGTVLIVGGNSNFAATAAAEIYNPADESFTATTGSLLAARQDHTATLLPSGQVLIVGGRNQANILTSAELYDPGTGLFTATTHAPQVARTTHTATLLGNGKVLIAGGFLTANLLSAELYDPTAGTFTLTGSMAAPRAYHTDTLLPSGKVLMVGGATAASIELYDPVAGTFANAGSLVTARVHYHTAALLPTGKVLIAGGVGVGSPGSLLSEAELYDPVSGSCTATGPMTMGRENHTATVLPSNGKTLVAGGVGLGYLASAELYY